MLLSRSLAILPDPFRKADFTGSKYGKMDLKLMVMRATKFVVDKRFRQLVLGRIPESESSDETFAELEKIAA